MRLLATVAAAICMAATAALADPTGRYDVIGTQPGQSGNNAYTGSVAVERTGDTYQVIWTIGGQRVVGTGLAVNDTIAVSYRYQRWIGVIVLTSPGDGTWQGIWTIDGTTTVGTEKWVPR